MYTVLASRIVATKEQKEVGANTKAKGGSKVLWCVCNENKEINQQVLFIATLFLGGSQKNFW